MTRLSRLSMQHLLALIVLLVGLTAPVLAVDPADRPVVGVQVPVAGSTFAEGSPVHVLAYAVDGAPGATVSRMEFFVGDQRIGQDHAAPYLCTWQDAPVGEHQVRVEAVLRDGSRAHGVPCTIRVSRTTSLRAERQSRDGIVPRSLGVLVDDAGRRIALFGYENADREHGCRAPEGGRGGRNALDDSVAGQCSRFAPGAGVAFCVPFSGREIKWRIDGREATCRRDDPPPCPVIGVSFAEATTSVREDVGTATITVRLTQPAAQRITVGYAIAGSATAGVDHDASAGTLTFERCASTATIRVPIRDDREVEEAETVILTLRDPVGAVLGRTPSHTLTIIDDDTGGCDERLTVFGPVTVVRSTGCPERERFRFPAPCLDAGVRYRLVLVNGDDAAGKPRATSVEVELNDREIWDHCDVKHAVDRLEQDVCLRAWNTLEVEVWGKPTSQVTLWIEAYDPRPLRVSFDHAASTAPESVARPAIAVRLNRPPLRAVTVPVVLDASGTATVGTDVRLDTAVTFVAGQSQALLPLTIIDDTVPESAETAVAVLGATPCVRLGCTPRHTLTITDDDAGGGPPSIAFQVDQSQVDEMSITVPVSLVLSAPTTAAVSVAYTVGGTAAAGSDHVLSAGTVNIPAGATSASISVPILADATHEGDETIILTLAQPSGATLGAITIHTLTIRDNDAVPTVAWITAASQVGEDAGAIAVALGLDHPSTAPITVSIARSGSATVPADLDAPAASVTIPPGSTQAALPLVIRQDLDDEADESVVLTLTGSTGAAIGTPATHTLTIRDDDAPPSIAFATATAAIVESAGTANAIVRLSAPSGLPVVVGYAVGGTAAPGDTTLVSGSIQVPAGTTEITLPIPVVDNQRLDGDRTVVLTLTDPEHATLGAPAVFVLTIQDDETPPIVAFASAASTTAEAAGPAAVAVHLDRAVAWPVTITITTGSGTATIGTDTGVLPTTVTVPAGATTAALVVPVTDDVLDEVDETVQFVMSAPSNAVLGATVAHTLTIVDDDAPPTVSWSAATASIAEAGGTATLTIRLSSASSLPVSVALTVGGTAGPSDATPPTGLVHIPAGTVTAAVAVPVIDDQLHEADETVILTLGTPVNATLGEPATTTLTITDDDPLPVLTFAVASSQAVESAGQVTVAVQLDRAVAWPTTVRVLATGDAVVQRDYAPIASEITIPAGVRGVSMPITLIDNTLDEPDRSLILTLSDPVDATLGTLVAHTLTIQDDDAPPTVAFSQAAVTVDEGAGTTTLHVRLSAVSGHAVVVPLTVGGTAGPGDATVSVTSVTIPPGSTEVSLPVAIVDDVHHEMDETVVVTLGAPTGATLGDPVVATVTITDNDPLPVVAFTLAASAVDESAGTASIAIALDRAVAWPVSMTVAVDTTGTATPGTDTGAIPTTITIPAGATSAVCAVPITADDIDEEDETLVLRLVDPVDGVLGAQTVHTLTIRDDDAPPTVAWSSPSADIAEAGGTSIATLRLSSVSGRDIVVPIAVSGSADAADRGAVATAITIPAGASSASLTIAIVDDLRPEADETVVLTIGQPTAATRGEPAEHVITIRDNDLPPTVAFALASSEIQEGAGTAAILLQLDRTVPWPVQVTVTGTGTAVSGVDIGAMPSSVTIPAQTASVSIPVSIIDDALDGPDLSLALTISAPVDAVVGAIATHTLTIVDDDQAPTVAWVAATVSVGEADGVATIGLRLSAPSGQTVSVPYTIGGTAGSSDHGGVPGTVTIPAGTRDAVVSIPLVDDDLPESAETIIVTIGQPQHAAIGTPATCTVTIVDNDQAPAVAFLQAASAVDESSAQVQVGITLDRVVSYPVTVDLLAAGSATVGADYDAIPASVTIPAGSRQIDLPITVRQDALVEGDETIVVRLVAAPLATIGTPAEHTITIRDDDVLPSVSFRLATATAAEDAGTVPVDLVLSTVATAPVAVSWLVGGDAALDADHRCAPGRITIPTGATGVTINVPIIDDALHEATEQVVLTLTGPTGANLGAVTAHTLAITDNDPLPTVAFAQAASRTVENAGAAAVAVRLDQTSGVPVVVQIAATGSTTDIDPIAPTLTIPAGQTTALVVIGLRDNAISDGDRTVDLALAVGSGAVAGSPATHVLTIGDDDLLPTLAWSQPTAVIGESGGTATLLVRLDRASQGPVTATLSVGGTAISGQDVGAITGSITIPAGSTQATVAVPIIDDVIPEVHDTVVLTLTGIEGALRGTPEVMTLTIADDDTVGVVPLVEHVLDNGDGTWTAWFGYRNTIADRIGEPIGPRNHMAPEPENQGQAVVFPRGRSELWPGCAFSSTYTTSELIWHLGGSSVTADPTVAPPPAFPGRPVPSHPPVIRIAAPSAGAVVVAGQPLSVQVDAYDVDGSLVRVDLLVDGAVATTVVPRRGRVISLLIAGLAPGAHQLSAVAVDDQQLSSVAVPVAIRAGAAPAVSLARLGTGPIIAGSDVVLVASPTDADGNLARVEFHRDGMLLAAPSSAPWQATVTAIEVGSHQITATAIDADGFRASDSLILVATSAPLVQVTYPASGQIVQPPATGLPLQAAASDADGQVVAVRFLVNGVAIGTATSSPYRVLWTTSVPGAATIVAEATDDAGVVTTSAPVACTVNTPPSVAVTAPVDGAVLPVGSSITATATATDVDGSVTVVVLMHNGERIQESATGSVSAAVAGLPAGDHVFSAEAIDAQGAYALSTPVRVRIDAPPVVAVTAPASGTIVNVNDVVTLTATASDADGTISRVTFWVDGQFVAEDVAEPYSASWTAAGTGFHLIEAKATDNTGGVTTATTGITVNTPPMARWYLPTAGSSLGVGVTHQLIVEANDTDGTVTAVEFRDGDTVLSTDTTGPYEASWTPAEQGTHQLSARVTDSHGATTVIALEVLIAQPPIIALISPVNEGVYPEGANLLLAADVSDPDGTISRVVFAIDGRPIGTQTAPPWAGIWPQLSPGHYVVTATATDNLGLSSTATASIRVKHSPKVTVIAPVAGQVFAEGTTVRIEAATLGLVLACSYYDGETHLFSDWEGPDLANGVFVYERVFAPGEHLLRARVTTIDLEGVDSPTVAFRVNASPSIAITAPVSGTIGTIGGTIPITFAAADREGVARVDILHGDAIVAQTTAAAATLDVPVLTAGPSTYVARVVDTDGAVALSQPLQIIGNHAPDCILGLANGSSAYDPVAGLTLSATATDADGSIARVEFFDGETLLGTVGAAPFQFVWFGAEPRVHVLRAIAIDDRGARGPSNTLSISVNALPQVRITAPLNGTAIAAPASPTVVVEALDADDGVARVELRSGTTVIATRTAEPWEFPLGQLASATYTITAVAFDQGGQQATSTPVTFTVAGGPAVAITAPLADAIVHAGTPLTISLDASGSQTISRVEVYAGEQPIGSITAAPWTLTWTPTTPGPVALTATAIDALGLSATSLPVPVIINAVPSCALSLAIDAGVTLQAQASDSDGQVVQVEFHADDVLLATVATAPYTWTWASPPIGRHTVTATAVDDRGARGVAPARILTVGSGGTGQPPSVRVTAPVAGARLAPGATVDIAATATDSDGTVSRVEFFVGGTVIATVAVPPYATTWTPPGLGRFALTAIATDNDGNTATATAVDVLVEPAPQVALTAPAPHTVIQPGQQIDVQAVTAGTPVQVEFLLDGAVIATDTTAPWAARIDAPAIGSHALAARATDDRGVASTSTSVPIVVTTPPTVALTAPTAGARLIQGEPVTVTTDVTDDGIIAQVVIRADGEVVAGATQAPWQSTWVPRTLGATVLVAAATDDHGLSAVSSPVPVQILARPSCGLDVAVDGTSFILTASPADTDGTVNRVEFRVDGVAIATRTSAPWTTTWAPPGDGTFRLQAVAIDNDDLAGPSPERLVAANGGAAPPSVVLTQPNADTRIDSSATLVLTASADVVGSTITRIEFYDQTQLIGTAHSAPWTFTWQPTQGLHGVAAMAYAANGTVGVSTQVRVLVDTLPTVTVTAPVAGAIIPADQPLRLTAQAADADDGLVQVVFRDGAQILGTVTRTPVSLDLPSGLPAGSHTITAEAMDTFGQVAVSAPVTIIANQVPTVTVAAPAVVRSGASVPVTASAADSDGTISAVSFRVDGVERAVDGTAPYAVDLSDLSSGRHDIVAVATDNRGMSTTSAVVTCIVDVPPMVSISSPASGMAVRAGVPTTIIAQAADADGRITQVAFSVDGAVVGIASASPWQVPWMPTPGSKILTATATDDRGESTTSSAVVVTAQAAPSVAITAPSEGEDVAVGAPLTVTAVATDVDGQVLAVRFYAGSTLIGTATGAPWSVVWAQPAERTHDLTAIAVDNDGLTTTSAMVSVDVIGDNQPPTVALTAPVAGATAWSDEPLALSATAADPDGTIARVEWLSDGAVIATRTAAPWQSMWSTPTPGTHAILVRAIDDRGARSASAPVEVTVRAASARPQVALATPVAGARLVAGMPLDLTATVTGSAAITSVAFRVNGVDVGSASSAPWEVVWTPAAPGTVVIGATAIDATGATGISVEQTFQVVEAGLQVVITAPRSGAVLVADRATTITAEVYDALDIDRVEFYAGATLLGTDTSGPTWSTAWTPTLGAHTLTAVLYDRHPSAVADNGGGAPPPANFVLSMAQSAPVDVTAVADSGAVPQVAFTYPATDRGTIGLEAVRGTATTTNPAAAIVSWALTWHTFQDGTPHPIATGTGPVTDAALGLFDTSLLRNGVYILDLTAQDSLARSATATRVVVVEGGAKPGEFGFSVQDLVVNIAGIPLSITRSYSTLNRERSGDFGYGWTASFADLDVEVEESRQVVTSQSFEQIPIRNGNTGRDVSLTLPGGRRVTFTFGYSDSRWSSDAVFRSPPGETAKLFVNPRSSGVLVWGIPPYTEPYWYWLGTAGFAQAPYEYYDLPSFALALEDGTTFIIDRKDYRTQYVQTDEGRLLLHHWYGKPYLSKIITPNGQTITFADGEIVSRTPDGVVQAKMLIVRDDAGRIWKVYDPARQNDDGTAQDPASLIYHYSSAGDLVAVDKLTSLDDPEHPVYETTTYGYEDAAHAHYLTKIEEPTGGGSSMTRMEYDAEGRLVAIVDAAGNRTTITNDLAARTQTVFDRRGNPTVNVYDGRGRVVETIDVAGNRIKRRFNDDGDLMEEIDQLNRKTEHEYDARHRRTATVDPLGHRTEWTYDTLGNITSITDALGRVTRMTYDAKGNQLTETDAAGNIRRMSYDGSGLLLSETDAMGFVTWFSYNARGQLTALTDAEGKVTWFENNSIGYPTSTLTYRMREDGQQVQVRTRTTYTASSLPVAMEGPDGAITQSGYFNGQMSWTQNALGQRTSFAHDTQGRMTGVSYPDGTSESFTYDADGNRLTSRSRSGAVTRFAYDNRGRLETVTRPDGTSQSMGYDAAGQLTSQTDARGNTTQFGYDLAGRRTSITTDDNRSTSFELDAVGNQTAVVDPAGNRTEFDYDVLNRRTHTHLPGGAVEETRYNANGWRTHSIDALGNTTQYGYDKLGRLTGVTDAAGGVTRYVYDAVGNQVTQIDALGRETRYAYDNAGRRIARVLPLGQREEMDYDLGGRLVERRDFRGRKTTYGYDDANRLERRTPDAGEAEVRYTYWASGRRKTMTDALGLHEYGYDLSDRLTSITHPYGSLGYRYDAVGNLAAVETDRGFVQTYGYDDLNRLNAVMWGGKLHQYGYDTAGRLGTATAGNGLMTSFGYDSDSRLRTQTTMRGASTVASYGYTVDAAGRRTDVIESGGVMISYGYDGLHRLVSSNRSVGATTYVIGYEHDAVGNRTKLTRNGVAGLSFYDANDRLEAHQYDAAGNTISSAAGADQYDSENRLVKRTRTDGTVVTIAYDGDGTKVSETVGGVTTWFLVSDLNPTGYSQTIEERRGGVTTQRYVWGLGLAPVAIQAGEAGATHYPVTDGQGSVRLLTDAGGSVTDSFDFDEFGVLIGRTGATRCTHLYSGYALSEALGSYYLRARYYAPGTGRLWTMDEFEGDSEIPGTLNKYTYCLANPVDNTDPTGLFTLAQVMQTINMMGSHVRTAANYMNTTKNISASILKFMIPSSMFLNFLANGIHPDLAIYVALSAKFNGQMADRVRKMPDAILLANVMKRAKTGLPKLLGMLAGHGLASAGLPIPGLGYKLNGFPDFTHYRASGNGSVAWIRYSGNRSADKADATFFRRALGGAQTSDKNYNWHHNEVMGVMELIDNRMHRFGHVGGVLYYQFVYPNSYPQ